MVQSTEFTTSMKHLFSSTTLSKGHVLKISINCSVMKEEKKIIKQHQKKMERSLQERGKKEDISVNSGS